MKTTCPLCHSETEMIHHPKIADYRYCLTCEFISKDEEFFVSKTEELKIYNLHQNSIDDPRYVDFFYQFLNDAVFPYASVGRKGLDFGSGPSPVLSQLLERNHDYQMDIYDVFYASEKVYLGKQYDLITTTEVVEHLQDPLEYFKLFSKLLKPQGILAVMTLFHENDSAHFLNWHYIRDRSHISFYTAKTMKYIASQVGLRVIHSNNKRFTTFVLDKSSQL